MSRIEQKNNRMDRIKTGILWTCLCCCFLVFSLRAEVHEVNLEFHLEQFPVKTEHFSCDVTGKIDLGNPLKDLAGTLDLDINNLIIHSQKELLSPMKGHFSGTLLEKVLKLSGNLLFQEAFPIDIAAVIPLEQNSLTLDQEAPIALTVKAEGNIASLLPALGDDFSITSGHMNFWAEVSGTLNSPQIEGKAYISNATMESLSAGTVFQQINAYIETIGHDIVLQKLSAVPSNGGFISGSGTATLSAEFPFELHFTLQDAAIVNLDTIQTALTGSLILKGTTAQAWLQGETTASSTKITLPERTSTFSEAVEITYINQSEDEASPTIYSRASSKNPLNLDLIIRNSENLQIVGNDLDSEWQGSVKITGTTNEPEFHGDYKILSGQYRFNGNPFDIRQGQIALAGNFENHTNLYVVASKDLDKVVVEIVLKGTVKKPELTFRSTPPLPQREILSWILFNRGSTEINPMQDTQLNTSLADLASKKQGPDLLSKVRNTLGVDRIDFSRDEDSDSNTFNVHVGKYLSHGIFVSVNKSDVNSISLEASLTKNIKLQAEIGDDAEGQLLLKWKHDY